MSDTANIASIRFGGDLLVYAPVIAAVSLPAWGLLLIGALGGLAALRHRKMIA
ncbi:hypothetical protein [Pseudotabrizicola formosa]|uniref:hypothetical protein n=1 Tax=Pseudotabrizicola formosa TaxID=2030009 RepID=UPI00143D0DD5|nr:hypothetical protein [Pseudotabrizicola formosa]